MLTYHDRCVCVCPRLDPQPEMLPSPHEHRDFLESEADQQVSDFLSDEFQNVSCFSVSAHVIED